MTSFEIGEMSGTEHNAPARDARPPAQDRADWTRSRRRRLIAAHDSGVPSWFESNHLSQGMNELPHSALGVASLSIVTVVTVDMGIVSLLRVCHCL